MPSGDCSGRAANLFKFMAKVRSLCQRQWAILLLAGINTAVVAAEFNLQIASPFQPAAIFPAGGGGDSGFPILSADGRFVLFASTANNLATVTNGMPIPVLNPASLNVYLRNCQSNTTSLTSVNLSGSGGGDGDSLPSAISTNGQYVLFESAADDLTTNDTNQSGDVFVRDLAQGETRLVSVNTNGMSGNGASRDPVMTPDGCYVAFVSSANDLVPNDTNGIADVFVRDMVSGATVLASPGATATNSWDKLLSSSESPTITPNGRYVAFMSTATNLVPGVQTAGEIYLRDLVNGTTIWASANGRAIFQTVTGETNAVCCNANVSADGHYVAFEVCTNHPLTLSARGIILRYNRVTGATGIVSTNANVPLVASENIHTLDMTPDGCFIAYVANVGDFSGTNTAIYLWDAQTGTNILVSLEAGGGLPANGTCGPPVVSADGRHVAFLSDGSNLTANPVTNGLPHLYLRDVLEGITTLVSADTPGVDTGVMPASIPSMSANGQTVAFTSARGLSASGNNGGTFAVFVHDAGTNGSEQISVPDPTMPGNGPTISWPITAGQNYRVEFNDNLRGQNWQDVLGTPTFIGEHGYVTDFAPANTQRFYRVAAY